MALRWCPAEAVSYENPDLPHEVNVARQDPLLEFLRLAAGLVACIAVLGGLLYLVGERLARAVPFALERQWVGDTVLGLELVAAASAPAGATPVAEIEPYLQRLADGLAATMGLPDGMTIRVHFADAAAPNAFATLGGHIVVTRGLYARMASENALAMVIAHEIGHVRQRDPIAAVGGSASLALLLAMVGGDVESLAPQVTGLVQRGYSRDAERLADEAALGAVERFYGHAGGAAAVFRELSMARTGTPRTPTLLSTHPTDAERIARLEAAAAGWDPAVQPLRPIAFPLRPPAAP
jgi:beta-barrel assembly-enhancing protease